MSVPDAIRPVLQVVVYHAPFLAHLALALQWRMDATIDTACTDGVIVRVNPDFFSALSIGQQAGLVTHEALHCALRHNERAVRLVRTQADAARWNVAADIVVNGTCARAGLELPAGAIRDKEREHLSVEEIYRALQPQTRRHKMGEEVGARARDLDIEAAGSMKEGEQVDWPGVLRRADILAKRYGGNLAGSAALGLERELQVALGAPTINWRNVLWRFLTESPSDWSGWDRRRLWQGFYLPQLQGRKLRAVVGIDTSGSVDRDMLRAFLAELDGILAVVDGLEIDLYWTDTRPYGPVHINRNTQVGELRPKGGGGTDLGPLFEVAAELAMEEGLARIPVIYLTDGFGPTLAHQPDAVSALWVIPEHGRLKQPWGEVVPMEVTS